MSRSPDLVVLLKFQDTFAGHMYCIIVLSMHVCRSICRILTFALASLANTPWLVLIFVVVAVYGSN